MRRESVSSYLNVSLKINLLIFFVCLKNGNIKLNVPEIMSELDELQIYCELFFFVVIVI